MSAKKSSLERSTAVVASSRSRISIINLTCPMITILLLIGVLCHFSQQVSVLAGGEAGLTLKPWPTSWMRTKKSTPSHGTTFSGSNIRGGYSSSSSSSSCGSCSKPGSCKPSGTFTTTCTPIYTYIIQIAKQQRHHLVIVIVLIPTHQGSILLKNHTKYSKKPRCVSSV